MGEYLSNTKSRVTLDERYACLEIQYEAYCHATKAEKCQLLGEMVEVRLE